MKPTYEQLEQQLAAVVAECAHARQRHMFIRALAVSILEHSGGRMDWRGAMEDAKDLINTVDEVYAVTPATDAYLAEVRARGVELFAKSLHVAGKGKHPYSEIAEEFAAQLRQGAEQ